MALACPVFDNPERYLELRKGRSIWRFLKRRSEERALDWCLRGLDDVRTVCDAPSGPARLFEYWGGKGFRVIGVDISVPMVRAAEEEHHRLGLEGGVHFGDVFRLRGVVEEEVDLVASIRFAYYFDRETRIALMRSLAAATRRYVLVQYKTSETLKGRMVERRSWANMRRPAKHYCSFEQSAAEVREAGLVCLRIAPISEFSDRAFVLAGKPQGQGADRPCLVHSASWWSGRRVLRRLANVFAARGK
jgi:hypothetical protein